MDERKLYVRLRRVFGFALAVALVGVFLAISVGEDTASLRGRIGAITVLVAIAVGILITPVGLVLTVREWQRRYGERQLATEQFRRGLAADNGGTADTRSSGPDAPAAPTSRDKGSRSQTDQEDRW